MALHHFSIFFTNPSRFSTKSGQTTDNSAQIRSKRMKTQPGPTDDIADVIMLPFAEFRYKHAVFFNKDGSAGTI